MEGLRLYCSFCGKGQHEVFQLIVGENVFICDECVDLSGELIKKERAKKDHPKKGEIVKGITLEVSMYDKGDCKSAGKIAEKIWDFVIEGLGK